MTRILINLTAFNLVALLAAVFVTLLLPLRR